MFQIPDTQMRRLIELLQQLADYEAGDPDATDAAHNHYRSFNFDMTSQERQDTVTLHRYGLISHPDPFWDPSSHITPLGIYAYNLTDDGRALLDENVGMAHPSKTDPTAFIAHGSDPNGYVPQVEETCRMIGITPVRMMEQPNQGQTLPEKLLSTMAANDFFIAVLTADEEFEGEKRARLNAYMETGMALQQYKGRMAILVEPGVTIPTNLLGLAYIELTGEWRTKLIREIRTVIPYGDTQQETVDAVDKQRTAEVNAPSQRGTTMLDRCQRCGRGGQWTVIHQPCGQDLCDRCWESHQLNRCSASQYQPTRRLP